eukprot:CAMPEP_0119307210 /NCGR_PEP_ID=MMETSP1333-20130426/7770_1 /TAXON_ID=418940 /ORGANISM="Scyphosphaera apsteinii, Strain RCC1455" /LENGTH=156 /DNA_ID=CAMNT_0007310701 /DNA_START=660 /DNA_END=1126 /DNA_ORIENTATION=+
MTAPALPFHALAGWLAQSSAFLRGALKLQLSSGQAKRTASVANTASRHACTAGGRLASKSALYKGNSPMLTERKSSPPLRACCSAHRRRPLLHDVIRKQPDTPRIRRGVTAAAPVAPVARLGLGNTGAGGGTLGADIAGLGIELDGFTGASIRGSG